MRRFSRTIVIALGAALLLAACDEGGEDGPCDGVTCSGHGTCVATAGVAACNCDDGYHAEDLSCVEDPDPCEGVDCSGQGSCVSPAGTALCECNDGYHAVDLTCVENGQILGTDTDEERALSGLLADAAVVYGGFGVPSIFAANDADAAFMTGYIQAEKRLPQMHVFRLAGAGRMSELAGALMPSIIDDMDIDMRLVTITRDGRPISRVTYEESPAEVKAVLDAYAAGVNERVAEWIDDPSDWWPQFQSLAMTPDVFTEWKPEDSMSFASYLAWYLADRLGEELRRTEYAQVLPKEVYDALVFSESFTGATMIPPAPAPRPVPGAKPAERTIAPLRSLEGLRRARARLDRARAFRESLGFHNSNNEASNNWVVGPDGQAPAFLSNDPHLPLDAPGFFFPVLLDTKILGDAATGWHARGLSLAAAPTVIVGASDHCAWGVTNSGYDVSDIWEEQVTYDGEGKPQNVTFNGNQVDVLEVELSFQMGPTEGYGFETRTVYIVPHHGPIILDSMDIEAGTALSWRWTGHDPAGVLDPWLDLPRAQNLDEAFAAIEKFDIPAQNWVVATTEGDIGLYPHGWVPIRSGDLQAHPPWLVMPGTGEYEWTGRIPSGELPQDRNPAAGYLATANEDMNGNLLDNDALNDEHYLYFNRALALRSYRIREMLGPLVAAGGVTAEDMKRAVTDTHYTMAALTVPAIMTILDGATLSADAQYFADLLNGWDFSTPSGLNAYIAETAVPVEDQAVLEASVATTFYSALIRQLLAKFQKDEIEAAGMSDNPSGLAPLLLAITRTADGTETSILWDDVSTDGAVETPQDIVVAAFEAAVAYLTAVPVFEGKPKEEWLWGYVHTLSPKALMFEQINDLYDAPTYTTSAAYGTVNPGGFGFQFDGGGDDFSYANGASIRIVNTVTDAGITTEFALPSGVSADPADPHFQDLMQQTWLPHEFADFPGELADILAAKEKLVAFRKK